ncbi:hypothetical protein AURDEDRAFT_164471 [Auricularia subglabra TFB-10046 SS5]|nr:hypothetical protein AURDEDRAFT_164471 [Auricularia subglabra TFB-10046 SS5]
MDTKKAADKKTRRARARYRSHWVAWGVLIVRKTNRLVLVLGIHLFHAQGRLRLYVHLDPESVEDQVPDLPEAMHGLMFVHHLRKQHARAREDARIKLTLDEERAAADSRLCLEELEVKAGVLEGEGRTRIERFLAQT